MIVYTGINAVYIHLFVPDSWWAVGGQNGFLFILHILRHHQSECEHMNDRSDLQLVIHNKSNPKCD